ncbi:hypothetical protein OAG53_02375 [Akkermansiaceae bacterium]|nr:hypothetical protein [Akkermansiaceae bacterium]
MKTSQLLSSEMTLFHKKIFPIFWCGFLICIILGTGISSAQRGEVPPAHLLVLLVILVLGYFVIKTLAFDLADEVLRKILQQIRTTEIATQPFFIAS